MVPNMYSIYRIATLITEDPDIFNEDIDVFADGILCEAASEKYLNAFNKSTVKVGSQSDDRYGNAPLLKDLNDEAKIKLIDRIKAIVKPGLVKYEQYFVRQVAAGNMSLTRIEEDSERLNLTVAKFVKYSRKVYWKIKGHSTSILDFPDWRMLERILIDLEDNHIEYEKKDPGVLYSKKYVNNVMSLLLGDKPEVMIYYFRKVDCFDNSKRFGAGTQWCTTNSKNYFKQYHDANGLYIVELETPTTPRRPIYQISGEEETEVRDLNITRFGPRFADFMEDILKNLSDHMSPKTVQQVRGTLKNSGR